MIVVLAVLGIGVVAGISGYLAARRWPQSVEAPHVSTQTIAAAVEARPVSPGAFGDLERIPVS